MFNGERSSALTIGPIDTKIYMMIAEFCSDYFYSNNLDFKLQHLHLWYTTLTDLTVRVSVPYWTAFRNTASVSVLDACLV